MKATITIEQYDNGITVKWRDAAGEVDPKAVVALEREQARVIGETLWEDIRQIMDANLTNLVKMVIEYQVGKEEQ
jgi:hypothetical protein